MFQQLSCCLILCDMLFNNGMYKDVVNVIQKRSDELEKTNMKTSIHMNYLFFAASYKLVYILNALYNNNTNQIIYNMDNLQFTEHS